MTNPTGEEFKPYIRDIPDFPQPGIIFKDITVLLKNGPVFKRAVDAIAAQFRDVRIDTICSMEARGFILGAAIAFALGVGFVPLRKNGKLPWHTHRKSYDLEYGVDELEIHTDAINPGERVLLVDDLIATGGTVKAAIDLVREMGGELVAVAFLIELKFLDGRKLLGEVPVYSLMEY